MGIFFLTLLTFLVSIIGTITGFGMSTIMVPVVLLFLPLPETLLFVGVIHWFGDLWKILLFKHGIHKKLLIYFGIPGIGPKTAINLIQKYDVLENIYKLLLLKNLL